MTEIAVVGTGYVGLSTGVGLAEIGHHVVCLDIDASKVSVLQTGKSPIAEAGMDDAIARNLANKNLRFSTDIRDGVSNADVVFLCLPTPQSDDGSADMSFIHHACREISPALKSNAVVVNKSTVPVGSALLVKSWIGRGDVSVVSNPEFLRQGTALHDFLHPTRVVVGGDDAVAVGRVVSLYSSISAPVLEMNSASAEALKYAANSFLATKLTFINAVADICELVGADIAHVVSGLSLDPRIGSEFLNPGPGWGGSCFPKDTRALVKIAEESGYDFALLRGVIDTNDGHYARIVDKVIEMCDGSVAGKTIAAWGLTFKANTDDLRDSPAIKILTMLYDAGAKIRAYDPTATCNYVAYPWIEVVLDALDVCDEADVLAVLTEWEEFIHIGPHRVSERLKERRVVDGRNVLNKDSWIDAGFQYRGVGR